jgi:two-component sensor histidine kinase
MVSSYRCFKKPICYRAFNGPPKEDICNYCPTYKTLKDGKIHESVTDTLIGGEFIFIVNDNGVGFPKDLDFLNTDSFGLQLLNSLVSQIDGEITLYKSHGVEFKITFKDVEYK